MTEIVPLDASGHWIERARHALENGHCTAIPTETVYGLSADATNGYAVARIFELKGRPKFNPLICHVSSVQMAQRFSKWNMVAAKLAEAFWPGPLTLVLEAVDDDFLSPLVTAGLGTVGVRFPKGPAAQLIDSFGKPLAAPSANRSGRISPTTPSHVAEEFGETDLLVIDGGHCAVGLESTIVSVSEGGLVLLRWGSVTADDIKEVTGINPALPSHEAGILAPGMMKSHYAPQAMVKLNARSCETNDVMMGFGDVVCDLNLSETGDLREAAANLYAFLKTLDRKEPATICVSPIPMRGLGIAINDRLERAAAPRQEPIHE